MSESKYLDNIVEAYQKTNSNIFINASAGGGKTYCIKQLALITSPIKSVIFLAFNKSIAEELKSKLPSHIDVSTIHAKAYGILRSNIRMNVKINELKNFIYCKQVLKTKIKDKKKENAYFFSISSVIDKLKLNNLEPTEEAIDEICDTYGFDVNEDQTKDIINVMKRINQDEQDLNKSTVHNIDFTDMLYLCATKVKEDQYPKYDVVIIDESQDNSDIQQVIILNLLKKKGRLIAVGDEKQAINFFAGSSLKTFEVFKNRPNTLQFPLPITYRCPKKIVELANEVFPEGTLARESAIEGEVRNGSLEEIEDGDMVLCRNNKPLIQVWISLTKQRKKANILGKEFGQSIKNLFSQITSISSIEDILDKKVDELNKAGVANPAMNKQYIALQEKCDIIRLLYVEFGSVQKVYEVIDEIFSNSVQKGITLTSIHKSKGLEADRVFFLNSHLIPSKFAVSDGELYAERCLNYVAITRAKQSLIYINIE